MFHSLNFPEFDIKCRFRMGRHEIWDPIRKKYLVLTPEEWVRQNTISYLNQVLGYPISLIKSESGLRYNGRQKRTDIVAYGRDAKAILLVECKAVTVTIDQGVFEQAALYNKEIRAPFLVVTNGLNHYCCRQDFEKSSFEFIAEIPSFERAVQSCT